MKHVETVYVESKKIKCDGDAGISSHPAIYLNMNDEKKATCGYCGKTFIFKEEINK